MWRSRARLWLARQHAKIVGGRYVLVIHAGRFPDRLRGFSKAHQAAIVELSGNISRILCVNQAMKDALVEIGVPPSAISVVSSVVGSLDAPAPNQIPVHLQSWLAAHTPVLVATGAMMDIYGFTTIVNCAVELRTGFPDLGCLLLARTAWCDDSYQKQVYETIRRVEMGEHCLIEYDVPYVRPVLEACDVMLRLVNDSAGICLYEAAYAGCESVAYANPTRPAFTFTVPDGDSEALIAATQRCIQLRLADEHRRADLRQSAASQVAQNNEKIAALLREICVGPENESPAQ